MDISELLLDTALGAEAVDPGHQDDIHAYLRILRLRDEATYQHSVRVGLLASEIAAHAGSDGVTPRLMLWAGCLHDIGKALVPGAVLRKAGGFDADDHAAMEPHVRYGCDMLSDVHDWTAHVIVRHHRFGPRPYPADLPPLPRHLEPRAATIEEAARLLSLADYYDAMMHRKNDRNGPAPLDSGGRRAVYLRDNADRGPLVGRLEAAGVLRF